MADKLIAADWPIGRCNHLSQPENYHRGHLPLSGWGYSLGFGLRLGVIRLWFGVRVRLLRSELVLGVWV